MLLFPLLSGLQATTFLTIIAVVNIKISVLETGIQSYHYCLKSPRKKLRRLHKMKTKALLCVVVLLLLVCLVGQAAEAAVYHTVRPGDTLWKISQRYNTTVSAIIQANNIHTPQWIYPGQVFLIPSPSTNLPSRGWGFSAADLDLFARLVHAEAAGEPYIGQVAVAATVLNRLKSPVYPNTLWGVIYQVVNGYYQYSPVLDGRINLPANNTARAAVRDALNGWDPSYGATGFYNPSKTSNQWVRSRPVTTVIGNHIFFR